MSTKIINHNQKMFSSSLVNLNKTLFEHLGRVDRNFKDKKLRKGDRLMGLH